MSNDRYTIEPRYGTVSRVSVYTSRLRPRRSDQVKCCALKLDVNVDLTFQLCLLFFAVEGLTRLSTRCSEAQVKQSDSLQLVRSIIVLM